MPYSLEYIAKKYNISIGVLQMVYNYGLDRVYEIPNPKLVDNPELWDNLTNGELIGILKFLLKSLEKSKNDYDVLYDLYMAEKNNNEFIMKELNKKKEE